jgi:hypothetical protein
MKPVHNLLLHKQSSGRSSSVSIVTRLWIGPCRFRLPASGGNFPSSAQSPTRPCGPSLLPLGWYQGSFSGSNVSVVRNWQLTSIQCRN